MRLGRPHEGRPNCFGETIHVALAPGNLFQSSENISGLTAVILRDSFQRRRPPSLTAAAVAFMTLRAALRLNSVTHQGFP